MSEHEEIEEHIHHAKGRFDKVVAGTMAIIAACLAIVSVFGQHFNTETLLSQQRSSDQWAFYQAKSIRRYAAGLGQDLLTQAQAPAAAVAKYTNDVAKYDKQMADIQEKAKDFENERDRSDAKAKRFHTGEVFLEVAIVLSSSAILTKRRMMFTGGICLCVVGVLYAATGLI